MLGTRTVQHSSLGYNHKGAITRMDLEELTSPFTWEYDNVSGFLKQLSYPNGLVRKNIYHPTLNLFSSINYEDLENGDMIAGHTYQYDELMRPIQRQNFWDATTSTTRNFTYNSRSELVNDQFLAGENFVYQYDNIGTVSYTHLSNPITASVLPRTSTFIISFLSAERSSAGRKCLSSLSVTVRGSGAAWSRS